MKCTWVDCKNEASVPQIAKDGKEWANLCEMHDREINQSIENYDIRRILSGWVKAQGGGKKAAARLI